MVASGSKLQACPRPPALALVSGKGGVGRSSLSLNLALSLGTLNRSILLIDADPHPGHLALLGGVESPPSLLATGCAQTRSLSPSVDLLQVFPPVGENPHLDDLHMDSGALLAFESQYDLLVTDSGPGIDADSQAASQAADAVWVIITPELTAVADGYATGKRLQQLESQIQLGCLVNAAESAEEAEDLQQGFADLFERFLGAQIDNRGYIPLDRTVRDAAKNQTPFSLARPSTPAALAVADLAIELSERHPIVTLHHHRAYLEGIVDLVSASLDGSMARRQAQEPSPTT
ncbi:MAG: P-loop NTPase [Candidatus Latescibacterota bacterium]|nr:P-loop NTPase [Candidatus Latescibacterota bacterium]